MKNIAKTDILLAETILKDIFQTSPYKLAAKRLLEAGFSSVKFNAFLKTDRGAYVPGDQQCNVMSEIIGLEKGIQ